MRGLAYLESRNALHQAAAIVRSPPRLALWLPYVAMFAYFAYVRARGPVGHPPAFGLAPSFTEAAAAIYLGGLGLTVALAAGGRVFAFRNGAEAVLFSNAGIRPLQIALWLQVRKLAVGGVRLVTGAAWLFLIFAPRHAGPLESARFILIASLAIAVQMSTDLPAFLLGRGPSRVAVMTFGWTLAAAGFGFAALALLAPAALLARTIAIAHVDPGRALAALLHGNAFGVLALVATQAALVGVVALQGNDALPEMYAASQKTLAASRLVKPDRNALSRFEWRQESATHSDRYVPTGALTMLWKDWLGFRRARGSLGTYAAVATFSAVCGVGAALASRAWRDPSPVISLATFVAIGMLAIAPIGASAGLASDLAKPLFWLSRSPLAARIGAWTFARTWRPALAIGAAPLCAGIVGGNVALALLALPLSFTLYGSLQALGIGLFALFPDPVDARGPMLFLRLLVTGAYAIPPFLIAIVTGVAFDAPLVAAVAAATTFAVQGVAVLFLASWRFAERGAAHAISR